MPDGATARVRDLMFPASVATFDEHPDGVILTTTAPPTDAATFTAFARFPDGRFAWLSSTAVWGRGGHPWAVVRRLHIDADAPAHPPAHPEDPRLSGGGELTVTDDLAAGRDTLSPARTTVRPARLRAHAWPGDAAGDAREALSVLVEDGITPASPSTITVLNGGALPSGLTLRAEPGLATRLMEGPVALTSATELLSPDAPPRLRRKLPAQMTVVADPSPAR
ncbi:hypothetical protein [Microbacterium sp. zg-YB36]|uniref:hypothetical protein n=1 Tax=Microbacterium sp. zg-YB36 TaxID=2969407 RepID=UPI00214CB24C|nr:hypothetical protein [Microbacterium sp. zg-YB36]MDL5351505.1 hypothetical protein [Microbacterium sp. zg-YB36]